MRRFTFAALLAIALLALVAYLVPPAWYRPVPDVGSAVPLRKNPSIDPDYTSLVIPPNIAPMNFRILEEGEDFLVRLSGEGGEELKIHCPQGNCRIPAKPWRQLLQSCRGNNLLFDIFAKKSDGTWVQFNQVTNAVAAEPIDSHIVYRRLVPNKSTSSIKGIFQRDLESFRVSALVTTRDGVFQCFNCHTFHQHDPNRFLIHTRNTYPGMNLVMDGEVRKIDTHQTPMFRPLAYASWHPEGNHIAATCNRFLGHFPTNNRTYYFEAIEKRGDLVVYDVEQNSISTTNSVFEDKYIETHPCWSADGKYIYFARGKDVPVIEPGDLEKFKFDIMRIGYETESDTWGSPEVVKAYSELGLSCAFPRPSPCGKYVLHIVLDWGTYPIHEKSSDVYLLDLETNQHRKLDTVCSDLAESFPRWSSNGRWFTFVSNRRDGISAIPYMAYFDRNGQAHKAFVLPQEDPEHYLDFIDTYNVVELVKSRVNVSAFRLAQGLQQPATPARFPNPPRTDAYTGPTRTIQPGY
jgi:hypothetical protein